MPESPLSRRRFLAGTAAVGATAVAASVSTAAGSSDWAQVSSPTGQALYDAVYANDHPWAVGASGNLLERRDGSWTFATDKFASKNKTLYAAAATDDGARIWAAGASGMVGYFDADGNDTESYKNPVQNGNTFSDVAVAGPAGDERVYLAGPSGHIIVGYHDSSAKDGMEWVQYDTSGGYTVNGLDFRSRTVGYAVTNGSAVYKTTDGGKSWAHIGIPNAQVPLFDVAALKDRVFVSGGSGHIYRLDCTCNLWTPFKAGSKDVSALTYRNGTFLGAGGSGRAYRKADSGWLVVDTPTGNHINGVVPGSTNDSSDPDVAVADSGIILER